MFGKVIEADEKDAAARNISNMPSPLEAVLLNLEHEDKERRREEEERVRKQHQAAAQKVRRRWLQQG